LIRRLAAGVVTLAAASFVIFTATQALPGDAASAVLGRNATPQTVSALRARLQLNRSLLVRYGDWVEGVLRGDLGESTVALAQGETSAPVAGMVGAPLRNSLILASITTLLLVPISLALGTLAGLRAGRPADRWVSIITLSLGALPEFVIGTLLILVFFTELHLLPPVSLIDPQHTSLQHVDELILPVLTLLCACASSATRQIRTGIIAVSGEDYVQVARLNGMGRRPVTWRYVVRNALAPSVQILAQNLQYLIGGIIVVESVFAYPGIGQFLVNAISARDITEVQAAAMVLAAIYILINILADLAVIWSVPRLRASV
jgi:peptide/nickel transport system permease protein